MICMAVSKQMLEYWDEFNGIDQTSIVAAMIFLVVLALYLLFGLYFSIFKTRALSTKHRVNVE